MRNDSLGTEEGVRLDLRESDSAARILLEHPRQEIPSARASVDGEGDWNSGNAICDNGGGHFVVDTEGRLIRM